MLISAALQGFGQGLFSALHHTDMKRSHILPDQLPGEHTALEATHLAQ